MLKIVGFTLLCAAATISADTYAVTSHSFQQGLTMEYEFPANEPLVFNNFMFWTIEANCKVTSEDEGDELFIEVLAKKGKINDVPLTRGQSISIMVHNKDNFKISADSGAKVQITNLGQHTIKAACSA